MKAVIFNFHKHLKLLHYSQIFCQIQGWCNERGSCSPLNFFFEINVALESICYNSGGVNFFGNQCVVGDLLFFFMEDNLAFLDNSF